jgi:hypothetical protein
MSFGACNLWGRGMSWTRIEDYAFVSHRIPFNEILQLSHIPLDFDFDSVK